VKLEVNGLSFGYHRDSPVLKDIRMHALPGQMTAIIGPNAAGKSTLMKCMAGMLKSNGALRLDGHCVGSSDEGAMDHVCYLPQDNTRTAALSVFETVLLGRLRTLSWRAGQADLEAAMTALEQVGVADLATRRLDELSGGQSQLVHIAQSLAGRPRVMLLDEPTSSLDLQHQLEVLELIRKYTIENGVTAVLALHDLNLAARYSDRFIVMNKGMIHSSGDPREVLTPEMLRTVYRVDAETRVDGSGVIRVDLIGPLMGKNRQSG
jgi:iron complex transport system ATP-binding protein